MEFIRRNTPKQINRNGYIVGGGNYSSSSFISSGGSGGATITNYLPAYLIDGYYQIVNPIKFINYKGEWEFYKRTTTTDENGEANEVDKMVMSISPNAIKLGDGSEVLTTKMFYVDDNGNLHTKYNIVSDGEIVAYVNGYSTNNGSGESGNGNISNVVIVDDLLSTLKDACLSANQGRILNEKINEINNNNHTHTNQNILDGITSTHITNWNNAHANNHTHGINKNIETYHIFMGLYGRIFANDSRNEILGHDTQDVRLNANGRYLYLGGSNTTQIHIPTYYDNGDGTTTAQWNSFNQNNLYMQMPLQVALQEHNNTQPPIYTNSTVMCTNLNANYVGGYKQEQLIKTSGNQTINGNITIKGNLIVEGGITATDEVQAYSSTLSTSLTTKIKTALNNVENATTIDEIKNILITLKNSI